MFILVWLSVILLFILVGVFMAWSLRGDARVPPKMLRAAFFGGVAVFAIVFVAFSWHTLLVLPTTTHAERLSASVVAGKVAWQKYVCIDCHTILGNGAYYAPDLTKSWNRFLDRSGGDEQGARAAMTAYLLHPPQATATTRGMPQFRMAAVEAASLAEYLKWTAAIDTNGWPPPPLAAKTTAARTIYVSSPGASLFTKNGCPACHSIGHGRVQGPDLAGVASRCDRETIVAFIQDPQTIYKREGRSPLHDGYPAMPSLAISPADAGLIADFLMTTKEQP